MPRQPDHAHSTRRRLRAAATGLLTAATLGGGAAAAHAEPIATFTVPDGARGLPTVSAGHDLVTWSAPTDSGRWGLRIAYGGKDLGKTFDVQRWPIDASVGRGGATTQILWSRCSSSSKAVSRAQAGGCDLVRLSKIGASGRIVSAGGANTKGASEYAPSRSGDHLVFARHPKDQRWANLVDRNTKTGKETTLAGGPTGTCDAACKAAGFIAGGPVAASIDGSHYVSLWQSNDTPDALGIAANDELLRSTLKRPLADRVGPTGLVSGTCSELLYGSPQQLGSTTQFVRHSRSCDAPTPAPGSGDTVRRADAAGKFTEYADPAGRRIVAAAADGDTLWVVREQTAIPADPAAPVPSRCSAAVGGCVLEAVERPQFKPVA